MEPLIAFGLPLLASGIYTVSVLTLHRQLLAQWQALAAEHNLVLLEKSSLWAPRLTVTARSGVTEVRFERIPKRGTWVQLTVPGLLAYSGLKLRRETFMPWGGREIEVGAKAFDETFIVEGTPDMATALLDAGTRGILLQVHAGSELEIRDGMIRVKVTDQTLPGLLPPLLELGQRLTQGSSIVRRLAANARRDPEPGVRLRNLLLLAREHGEEQVTPDTLRAACKDSSEEVRLRAAAALGAEGRNVLVALAETSKDDSLCAEAVSALDRLLPVKHLKAILNRSLKEDHLRTARVCLEALGRRGGVALYRLAQVLEDERDEVAAAAALSLGETGEAEAEAPLLRALRHGSLEVRLAAATALGRVGSVAAVLPLRQAAEEDRGLRRAARQSIGEIQSRLQGASPGQLSLAQSEAGQLSLVTDRFGQLSLRPEGLTA